MFNEAARYTVLDAGEASIDAMTLTDFELGLVLGGNESDVTGANDALKDSASTIADFGAIGAILGSVGGPGGAAIGAGVGASFGAGMAAEEHFDIVDGTVNAVTELFDAIAEAQANPDRG